MRRKRNYYELSPEEKKKYRQITIFEALEMLKTSGGGITAI